MQSNAALIDTVLGGDPAPFAELVRRHQRLMMAAAWHTLHDYHAAEDAAQETFVAAYKNLGSLRNHSVFGTWILRIARREALRLAKRRHAADCSLSLPDVPKCDEPAWLQDDVQHLLAAVAKLPEHERVVVMLHHIDGHTAQTIAEMTDRPLGTVTKQLSRAVARLRRSLAEVEQ